MKIHYIIPLEVTKRVHVVKSYKKNIKNISKENQITILKDTKFIDDEPYLYLEVCDRRTL